MFAGRFHSLQFAPADCDSIMSDAMYTTRKFRFDPTCVLIISEQLNVNHGMWIKLSTRLHHSILNVLSRKPKFQIAYQKHALEGNITRMICIFQKYFECF